MSTRANIIVSDGIEELLFYRHSDGYPAGTLPTLRQFLDLVKAGSIRDNVSQAAGWLILIGAAEYGVSFRNGVIYQDRFGEGMAWKCGSVEPTSEIHTDVEFLYRVDLKHCDIRYRKVPQLRQPTAPSIIAPRLCKKPGVDRNRQNGSREDG